MVAGLNHWPLIDWRLAVGSAVLSLELLLGLAASIVGATLIRRLTTIDCLIQQENLETGEYCFVEPPIQWAIQDCFRFVMKMA